MENTFFGESGLTSTSANHIANLAKEQCSNWEAIIDSLRFYTTTVSLIGSSEQTVTNIGCTLEDLNKVPEYIDKISKAKSLIAWLREAIKEKEYLINELETEKSNKIRELTPPYPVKKVTLTEEDYYNSLSIKERANYYILETNAAILGKIIHSTGSLNKARKKLSTIIQNPNKVEGSGRDTTVYTSVPSISLKDVDKVFFELQKKHRSYQAELNSIKNKCQEALNKNKKQIQQEYSEELEKYRATVDKINNDLNLEYEEKINKVNKLKIIIPNDLKNIYNEVSKDLMS